MSQSCSLTKWGFKAVWTDATIRVYDEETEVLVETVLTVSPGANPWPIGYLASVLSYVAAESEPLESPE